jgi:hypothetical protein
MADMLRTLAVPAYYTPGDNEWTDCSDPTQAWAYITTHLLEIENCLCGTPTTERQSIRPENFAFVSKGVLFIGVNLAGGSLGGGEQEVRMQDNADWVDQQFQDNGAQVRAAVVFGHFPPEPPKRATFFDQFEANAAAFGKPVLFINGSYHFYIVDNPFSQPNMLRLQVDNGAVPPVQVTVTTDITSTQTAFLFEQDPWPSGAPLYNAAPCVDAGPDTSILQTDILALQGQATDDGIPTSPGFLAVSWSQVSGPGTVTFQDPTADSTTATFSQGGVYLLSLTADDGELTGSDTLTVDVQSVGPSLTIDDVGVTEGNPGTTVDAVFTVSLSPASAETVTVDYATANGTATAGSDYVSGSGTVSFAAGDTTQLITVVVNGDMFEEPHENFFVNLSNPSNAPLADNQGQGTIVNDDGAPLLAISDAVVTEGDVGTVNAVFTVTLSTVSGQTVTVDYSTADSTATAPSDYTAVPLTTVSFAAGETSKTATVLVNGDVLDEADETFLVDLSNPVNATISDNQGVGTITDNDPPPSLSIDDVTADEGAGTMTFTVSLSATSGQAVNVDFATTDGSAVAPDDYTSTAGTLTIPADSLSGTITVPIIDDALSESAEIFTVDLSNPVNATLADSQGVGTITPGPKTIHVPGDYTTIQAGIDAAFNRDTVLVQPGTYQESLTINGINVTLASLYLTTGDPSYIASTIIDGSGANTIIDITNTDTSMIIIGFTLRNATDGILPTGKFQLLHSRVTGCDDGIDFEAGSGGRIAYCEFDNNTDDGIDFDMDSHAVVEFNVIHDNKTGTLGRRYLRIFDTLECDL